MAWHSRSKNGVASLAYVPAIHVFALAGAAKTWMPGTRPGMTGGWFYSALRRRCRSRGRGAVEHRDLPEPGRPEMLARRLGGRGVLVGRDQHGARRQPVEPFDRRFE